MRNLKCFARTTRLLVLASWLLATTAAHAEASADDKQKARAAYQRATAANDSGDYATAARELALADELVPNAVTLKAALDAALDADAPAIGMELVTRAETRGETGEIAEVAVTARKRFSGRAGRVKIVCPAARSCQATLDGQEISASKEQFVLTGKHVAIVAAGGTSVQREFEVQPMGLAIVNGPEEKPIASSGYGLAPGWFVGTLVGTVASGVGSVFSGVDTKEKHDAFVDARCTEPGPAPTCKDLAFDGQQAQTRTNVLVGLTAGFGLMTAVLGYFTFAKPNPKPRPVTTVSLEPRKDGAFARLVFVLP